MKHVDFIHFFLTLFIIGFTCTTSVSGPGTGSETTNGIIATVHYQEGTPAANVTVKIRPYTYLRDTTASASTFIDTITDSLGRIILDSLQSGTYTVEIRDSHRNEGAFFICKAFVDSIKNAGIIFLDPLGAIHGYVAPDTQNITGYVQVFGLDHIARIDSLDGSFLIDSLAPGTYTIRILPSQPSYMYEVKTSIPVQSEVKTIVDPIRLTPRNEWFHSRKIYLNTTATGADVPVNVYNFPLLIRLNQDNFDFITAKSTGEDIRFVKNDNIPLMHHIEQWDFVNNQAELWVNLDTVHGNDSTQYITMLWGNTEAQGVNNSGAVFDTTTGFAGVWHMDQTTSGTITDATDNHYTASCQRMPADSQVQGVIGKAQYFNGINSYMVIPNSASGKLDFSSSSAYSIAAWVKTDHLDSNFHVIVSKGNYQYGLQINVASKFEIYEYRDNKGWRYTEAKAISNEWKCVVGVHDGDKQFLYIDGVLVSSTTNLNSSKSPVNTSNNICIGRRAGESYRNFKGSIDEVRIYNWANDSNWIKLNYMNQRIDDKLTYSK